MTYGIFEERARRIREMALSLPPGLGEWGRVLLATKRVDGDKRIVQARAGGMIFVGYLPRGETLFGVRG